MKAKPSKYRIGGVYSSVYVVVDPETEEQVASDLIHDVSVTRWVRDEDGTYFEGCSIAYTNKAAARRAANARIKAFHAQWAAEQATEEARTL